jgi:hypothetical protein
VVNFQNCVQRSNLKKKKERYFYDNVTNDTIVVYFYRYVYTTHVKMVSILNYLIFLKINNTNLNGTYIQTGFCIFICAVRALPLVYEALSSLWLSAFFEWCRENDILTVRKDKLSPVLASPRFSIINYFLFKCFYDLLNPSPNRFLYFHFFYNNLVADKSKLFSKLSWISY